MHEPDNPRDPAASQAEEITPDMVRDALKRVLESSEFRASHRCQEFLRFVVETTLAGNGQTLKERTIGVEVFGRSASYDPGNDSTVRVKAGEVRKRLQTYYSSAGAASPIRIHLPAGGYLPGFHPAPQVARVPSVPPASSARRWPWLILAACAVSVLSIGIYVLAVGATSPSDPILRLFWGPALSSSNPVLLCVSYTPRSTG
jgi:hypothetical protein